jgi:hypothetical protein
MKKILIIFLSICFLLTTTASIIGIIEHGKKEEVKPPVPNNTPSHLVSYEYYLENEKQDTMPVNNKDSEVKYVFSNYVCTNGLSGTFDKNLWKFTPSEDKESLCSLYFANSQYEVTVTATNGIVENDDDGKFMIPRESEGTFSVIPNEGYKYKNVVCSNDNKALYDISTSTLTISSVMESIACKVNFEIMKFKAKINVVNGTGSTTEIQKYGSDVTTIVKAKDGYEKPTVKCTNSQSGSISNNTFSIYKLTDNTTCTVTYKKIPIVLYTLKITNLPSNLTIVSGSSSQKIKKGTDGRISIKPDEGYNVSLSCNVKPSSSTTDPDGTVNFIFLNVSKDITCSASTTN